MKKWLLEKLICPDCLPNEFSLDLKIKEEFSDDVMDGELICSGCGKTYPIRSGVAVLLPESSMSALAEEGGYNSTQMRSAYLWSHFSDLLKDSETTDAYQKWTRLFDGHKGPALDIGCSVGRLSLELSNTHSHVIGIDTSLSFIQTARRLLNQKKLRFDLIIEGHITDERILDFNDRWNFHRVDFVAADALALPFPREYFTTVSSINILEKVPVPELHLQEANRVLAKQNARFVFSDPFSWDESVSAPDLWIGGKKEGKYQGRSIDCMKRLLKGENGIFNPPMALSDAGKVTWKIRKTENLWEHITSHYLVGIR